MGVINLQDIRVLILDEKGHGRSLLRSLLLSLGLQRIVALTNTTEALAVLRDERFDLMFLDELAGPLNPVAFIKALRRDLSTRDVTMPVVLVSAGAGRRQIMLARDAGANDVISKPVSAETVERKLRTLLFAPQTFVTAKTFMGPDRRRASDDRRQFGERRPAFERRGQSQNGTVFVCPPRVRSDDKPPPA